MTPSTITCARCGLTAELMRAVRTTGAGLVGLGVDVRDAQAVCCQSFYVRPVEADPLHHAHDWNERDHCRICLVPARAVEVRRVTRLSPGPRG